MLAKKALTVMLPYPQADLINQLYQGKLKDYVRCLECGYESWRIDTYLDIPLVIRPFGASQAYCSVVRFSPHKQLLSSQQRLQQHLFTLCTLKATLNSVLGTV